MLAKILSVFTIIDTLKGYKKQFISRDITAALTVAIIAIPQSMAYALIAGVPPVYGLYTAIVGTIFGALFGNSNHLVAGPTNAIGLLIAGIIAGIMKSNEVAGLEMLFVLTLLVGLFQLVFAILRMGKIIDFISHSVIVGFTAGAGILIALGQLKSLLGISVPHNLESTQQQFFYTITHLKGINLYTFGIGLSTILLILLLKKLNNKLPGPLIAIFIAGAVVAGFSLMNMGVKLTAIPNGFSGLGALPPFGIPKVSFTYINQLWSGALAIAIIGLVEAVSISKSIATRSGQKLNVNQEIVGQSMSNIVSSFFSSFPGSGSFTRSAVNFQSGAVTRLSAVMSGIIVAVIIMFLGPFAKYIPSAALAGVIMVIAYGMVDKKAFISIIKAKGNDRITLIVTFLATVMLPHLDLAVYSGVVTSLILYLNTTNTARVKFLVKSGETYVQKSINDKTVKGDLLTVELTGNLYFGLAQDLENKLESIVDFADGFVLRLRSVTNIDLTALEVLTRFASSVKKRGGHVIVCGAVTSVFEIMITNHEFSNCVDNIYRKSDEYFDSYLDAVSELENIIKK